MAAFAYKAVDRSGSSKRGVIEAATAVAARSDLRARSLLPVSVEPTRTGRSRPVKIGRRAKVAVTRQLATMVGAGVRIDDALRTVADETSLNDVSSLLLSIRSHIVEGSSFAEALQEYPSVFDDFYCASVKAGESSGRLGDVMDQLADFTEQRAKTRQTVQLALLYPALLAIVSVAVIVALLIFVVPNIVRAFETRGADLPVLTRMLISASEGMAVYGTAVALGLGAVLIGGGWALRTPAIRLRLHRALVTTWPAKAVILRTNANQFTGTLATLIVSRVPLAEALDAASASVSNLYFREKAKDVALRVREGTSLSLAMRETGVFPPLLLTIVATGETGGTLGRTLTRAANEQTRDLDAVISAIVALVEPAVLLVMGLMVLLLVLSILLPITNLSALAG